MTERYSPMSINQLINTHDNDKIEADVQLAVEALGDLSKSGTTTNTDNKIILPPLSVYSSEPSTSPSSPLPTPSNLSEASRFSFSSDFTTSSMEEEIATQNYHYHQQQQQQQQQSQPFIHRVSNIPLVNSALKAYEKSTAQNMVKYGTDMVESFTAPIYDKFGKNTPHMEQHDHDEDTMAAVNALARTTLSDDDGLRRRRLDEESIRKNRSRPHSRSTSPHRPYNKPITSTSTTTSNSRHLHSTTSHRNNSNVNKSKWQQIVMHAGSAAGTTAAVVSEESMKCLRYCLHWLQYATQHIQQQMDILRNFLVSLAMSSNNKNKNNKTVSRRNQNHPANTLAAIQKEIVNTLRKVVEVVSRYAGVGLPSHAKASVRNFILQLPSRWATLNNTTAPSTTKQSPSPSSTSLSDFNNNNMDDDDEEDDDDDEIPDHVKETSIKLLNFGGESVEMLESVSEVFSDSIDRAEVWLDRLKIIGVAPNGTTSHQKEFDIMES
ncbi:unnamed protein product [Cunninghamella blakesleeana]